MGFGLDRLLMLELSLTLDLETCWSMSSESPEEANSLLSFSVKNYDLTKIKKPSIQNLNCSIHRVTQIKKVVLAITPKLCTSDPMLIKPKCF